MHGITASSLCNTILYNAGKMSGTRLVLYAIVAVAAVKQW